MKVLFLMIAVAAHLTLGVDVNNATKHTGAVPGVIQPPTTPVYIDPVPVKRTTYHDPNGKVTCSISIADDTDALQLTDDNFGYPKFMVDDEFKLNKLATMMFDTYLRKTKQDDNNVNLHLENSASISETQQPQQPQQPIVQNPFTSNHGSNALGSQANLFPFGNNQHNFDNTNSFPQHQNSGFQGFDFSSPIANTKDKANIVTNGFHFPSGGIPLFRKKRMTGSGFQTSFSGFKTPGYLCDAQMTQLRRYTGHGGKCYLIEPEIQNIKFAKCSKKKCSSCNDFSGVTQCSPETSDVWVWVYCDTLQQGRKVIYDQIQIPTHCACKTFQC